MSRVERKQVAAGIPKCFQIMNDPDAAPGGDYKFDPRMPGIASLAIRGSFSAGSTPISASKYAFFSIFRDLHDFVDFVDQIL